MHIDIAVFINDQMLPIELKYKTRGFTLHLWHPAWLIYLTNPMYYMLADAIGKA